MDASKLVTMLNQIATFHRRLPVADTAVEVAAHVEKFWERRMRDAAYAHLDAGGAGLVPGASAGLALLRAREAGLAVPDPFAEAELQSPLEA